MIENVTVFPLSDREMAGGLQAERVAFSLGISNVEVDNRDGVV
jgi:hypothetical protein